MPAARAGLARRVEAADPYEGAPALGALVLKQPCELTERGIRHGFRQMTVSHHALGVQVFHAQDLVLIREHGRDLMEGIGPGISDFRMDPGDPLPLFQIPAARFLAPACTFPAGEPTLLPRKLALIFLEVARISDLAAVRERRKRLDAEVDSDFPVGRGRVLGWHVGAEKGGEVAAGYVQGDRDRHETPLERSGYLSPDSPELRQRDMVAVDDLAAVGAVGLPAVPARLELGEARLTALAHASEEVLVGAVEVADGLLERHGVRLREPGGLRVALPRREHSGELRPRDRLARLRISGLLDVESAVVHETAATERPRDLIALRRIRVDSVFEPAFHRLDLLLSLYVLPYLREGHPSHGRHEVAVRPERGNAAFQPRELRTQVVARPTLDALDRPVDAQLGIDRQEQVHMVWHDLHLDDLETELVGDFPSDLLEALVDSVHEDGPAVLRAEDHVVAAGENYVAVALVLHGIDIIQY